MMRKMLKIICNIKDENNKSIFGDLELNEKSILLALFMMK